MSSADDASVAVGRAPALLSGLSENHTAVGATPSRVRTPRSGSGSPESPSWRKAESDCSVKSRVGAGLVEGSLLLPVPVLLLFFASAEEDRGMPRDAAAAAERRAERKLRASHVFVTIKNTASNNGKSSSSGAALGRDAEEEEREEIHIASVTRETSGSGGNRGKKIRASRVAGSGSSVQAISRSNKICDSKSSTQRAQKSTVGERGEREKFVRVTRSEE